MYLIVDYDNGKYGVMDSLDRVVEWYTVKELEKFEKMGIRIANYKSIVGASKSTLAKIALLSKDKDFIFSWSDTFGVVAEYVGKDSIVKVPNYVNAFSSCRNVLVSQVHLPDSCHIIGANAFQGCRILKLVKFPNRPFSIMDYAFMNTGITSADLSNCFYVGKSAFKYCRELLFVSSLGDIDMLCETFDGCDSLTEVPLEGSNVKQIMCDSFRDTLIKDIMIPPSVRYLELNSFNLSCHISVCNTTHIADKHHSDNYSVYKVDGGRRVYIEGAKCRDFKF